MLWSCVSMALSVEQLKKVKKFNPTLKHTVFGFIRQNIAELFCDDQSSLSVDAFDAIQWIVLTFYGARDEWDDSAIGQGLKNENNIITKHVDGGWCYRSAFLTNICVDGVHEWTFKIHKLHKLWNLIGIWRVNENSSAIPTETYFPETNSDVKGYALCVGEGKLVDTKTGGDLKEMYCDKCKEGDTVKMTLDMDQFNLRYAVNGIDQGIAFNVQPWKYRAAICLDGQGASIELLV